MRSLNEIAAKFGADVAISVGLSVLNVINISKRGDAILAAVEAASAELRDPSPDFVLPGKWLRKFVFEQELSDSERVALVSACIDLVQSKGPQVLTLEAVTSLLPQNGSPETAITRKFSQTYVLPETDVVAMLDRILTYIDTRQSQPIHEFTVPVASVPFGDADNQFLLQIAGGLASFGLYLDVFVTAAAEDEIYYEFPVIYYETATQVYQTYSGEFAVGEDRVQFSIRILPNAKTDVADAFGDSGSFVRVEDQNHATKGLYAGAGDAAPT